MGEEGEKELVVSLEQCIGHIGKCLGRDVQRLGYVISLMHFHVRFKHCDTCISLTLGAHAQRGLL